MMLETNIDDMNPEFYENLMEELFELKALDVYTTPIMMKKNRPANKLSVLASKEKIDIISEKILKNTTTFGVRYYEVSRKILDRDFNIVKTKYGNIQVKTGIYDGQIIKSIPEYEDCKKIAKEKDISIGKVYLEAQIAANNEF